MKGLKIIELASVLAGPSVGQFFAELGAEVIKIESPATGGDVTRSWRLPQEQSDDRSAYFCAVNWGKKSVAADLYTEAGKNLVHQLASSADMVIASYKPGDAEKLGVDYRTLSSLNKRLIYGQVTGYGAHNARVGYDAVIQAEAGFMSLNGEADGLPLKMPVALIDILAAHHLKEGLLLAIIERMQTGVGKVVEVSLIQAALASLANQATNWLVGGVLPQRQGSAHPNIAPYGDIFKTSDEFDLLLAIGNDKQFAALCAVLQRTDLPQHDHYITNAQRVKNRLSLNNILQQAIGKMAAKDLVDKLHYAQIPAGIIQNVKQALAMPEADRLRLSHGQLAGIRTFVASHYTHKLLPPPHFGEHTAEIIGNLRA